jgi:transcriptional regulator with XRE-family HTH domain
MHYWKDNHGDIYGPFNKQEDGFPMAGEVVRSYREKMKWSQARLALRLGVARLQVIQMEKKNAVPQSLSRRRAIAEFLQIPPVLLGVSVVGSDLFLELVEPHAATHISIAPYSLQEASEYLDTAWEAYTFTGSLSMLPGARRWKARVEEEALSKGSKESLEVLHRYGLFFMLVGRENQDYTEANPIRLVDVAKQLASPDAISVSLYRRGKMYYEQKRYEEAFTDIKEALYHVEHASPQVKVLTLACSGPVLTHYTTNKADVQEVLRNMDKGWKLVEEAKGTFDPFHVGYNEGVYFNDRAYSLIPLLRIDPTIIDEIWESLSLAQEKIGPNYIRTRSSVEYAYADASYHVGDYLASISAALNALELAQSIGSVRAIERVQKLYEKLAQTKIKDSSELKKLKIALAKGKLS